MKRISLLFLFLALMGRMLAASATIVILHTNDLHDHVRSGAGSEGGLPWIAGYVRQLRTERQDVILVDAGDVTEKGDLVADRTHGVITYEAMRRTGYDAVTLGNHDWDPGYDRARKYERALGQPILNVNLLTPQGGPAFTPSRILTRGALKVGVIGAIVPQKKGCLDDQATGAAIAREAKRLRPQVHLLVALCHEGSKGCAAWAAQAPEVDLWVSGHTHELLAAPVRVAATGARIVQTGSYAQRLGRMDLTVDLATKRIIQERFSMVPLPHTGPVDRELLDWVRAREQEVCPEAAQVLVADNPDRLARTEVAALGAEALRQATKADIAFCGAERIVRSSLYEGVVDVNALFVATGLGRATVVAQLTGAEIEAYLTSLQQRHKVQTDWAGLKARRKGSRWTTNLAADRTYRVAMTKLEWTTRFLRAVEDEKKPDHPLRRRTFAAEPVDTDVTRALTTYVPTVVAAKETLKQRANALISAGKG